MAKLRIDVEYADMDDWLALYFKTAPVDATNCTAEECAADDGWMPLDLVGGRGETELVPAKYYYRYEAGNTAGNKVKLTFTQDANIILKPVITIGSGNTTIGCNIFRIW